MAKYLKNILGYFAFYLKMRTMGAKDSNLQRSSSASFDVNEYTIETYNIEDSQAYYIVSRRKLYSQPLKRF